MFTKRIIPCLDVHNGRVVKGVNFVNLQDAGDPVEIAAAYDKAGADEVVSGYYSIFRCPEYRGRSGAPGCGKCIYTVYRRGRYPDRGRFQSPSERRGG